MSISINIANRLHVSASNREVIAAVRRAFIARAKHGPHFRSFRHVQYRKALKAHADNRQLFIESRF